MFTTHEMHTLLLAEYFAHTASSMALDHWCACEREREKERWNVRLLTFQVWMSHNTDILRRCPTRVTLITVNSSVSFPLLLSLSLSLFFPDWKHARRTPVGTAADTIVTEADRTRNERSVRVDRTGECYTPEIDSLSREKNSWWFLFSSDLPSLGGRDPSSRELSQVNVYPYCYFREDRVGSLNRGPVPWLLARPLAGFEWRAAIAPHATLRLSHSFSLLPFAHSLSRSFSFSIALSPFNLQLSPFRSPGFRWLAHTLSLLSLSLLLAGQCSSARSTRIEFAQGV